MYHHSPKSEIFTRFPGLPAVEQGRIWITEENKKEASLHPPPKIGVIFTAFANAPMGKTKVGCLLAPVIIQHLAYELDFIGFEITAAVIQYFLVEFNLSSAPSKRAN